MSERPFSDVNDNDASCRRRPRSLYAKTRNLLALIGPPPAPALTFARYEQRGVDSRDVKRRQLAGHRPDGAGLAPARRDTSRKKILDVRIFARNQGFTYGVIAPDPSPDITETPACGMNSLLCLDGVQGNDELLRRGTRSTLVQIERTESWRIAHAQSVPQSRVAFASPRQTVK